MANVLWKPLKTLGKSLDFFNQVKQEFFKITWTDKKQALYITGVVFFMVFIIAVNQEVSQSTREADN